MAENKDTSLNVGVGDEFMGEDSGFIDKSLSMISTGLFENQDPDELASGHSREKQFESASEGGRDTPESSESDQINNNDNDSDKIQGSSLRLLMQMLTKMDKKSEEQFAKIDQKNKEQFDKMSKENKENKESFAKVNEEQFAKIDEKNREQFDRMDVNFAGLKSEIQNLHEKVKGEIQTEVIKLENEIREHHEIAIGKIEDVKTYLENEQTEKLATFSDNIMGVVSNIETNLDKFKSEVCVQVDTQKADIIENRESMKQVSSQVGQIENNISLLREKQKLKDSEIKSFIEVKYSDVSTRVDGVVRAQKENAEKVENTLLEVERKLNNAGNNNTGTIIVQPLTNAIEIDLKFDGTPKVHPIRYLEQLKAHFGLNNLAEYNKLNIVRQTMRNGALNWYETCCEGLTTYQEFETRFLERYWSTQIRVENELKLMNRRYDSRKGQTLQQYAEGMIADWRRCDSRRGESEIIEIIRSQLPPRIGDLLAAADVQTLNELQRKLGIFDATCERETIRREREPPDRQVNFFRSQGCENHNGYFSEQNRDGPPRSSIFQGAGARGRGVNRSRPQRSPEQEE